MRATPSSQQGTRRDRLQAFARFLWQRFLDDKCFETAGALSYTTLFAIVPMLAAVIAIVSVFPAFAGLRDSVTRFIFRSFVPAAGETVQGYLLQFADNASKLTLFGVLFLLASALMMMASIEDRFNRIWRVASRRKGTARLLLYWAALTLGPILVTAGVGVSSWVYAQPLWRGVAGHGVAGFRLWLLAPFLITWVGLSVLYQAVPNCRVRWRDAITGALVAAVLFEFARKGFAAYVQGVANYKEVYGALAAIPIFLIWVYLSWVIVLLGAILAAALHAFEYRHSDELLPPGCEFVGLLRVVQRFAEAQRAGAALDDAGLRARERFLTADLLQRYLADLQRAGLIRRAEGGGWLVARDLDSVCADDLFHAGGYRLPQDAVAMQRAATGLAPEARVTLQRAEAALKKNLRVPLRELFCPASPAEAVQPEDRSS
ncbi:MAG: Inner membrane protein YihY, formerly thought to be RNase BN [Rhodanobacteraceae bacterium]|jgi:membrane protein|nr:MAG: Inner membrane protein YihY, formerly thought to be RNase BN [Rhodanobacteraceae bacterium]